MSKVHKVEQSEQQQEEVTELAHEEAGINSEIGQADRQAGNTHARRIVIEANVTGNQLRNGVTVGIPSAENIFKPTYDMEKLDEEQRESMGKLDFSKGIVTGMTLKAVYSNVPESVSVGLNLFANKPQITNTEGWLYSEQATDMGSTHTAGIDGFTNLVNVLPYEKARLDTKIYSPENLLNNRFIEQYGGYTLDRLWEGIVPFPKQDYFYVEADHIILKVIQRNWEMLGINTEQEKRRENQYVKVSKTVVNNVIKQLYEQVIMQIPYTSFDSLKARFSSNNAKTEENYKVMCEFLIQYKYPAISKGEEEEA